MIEKQQLSTLQHLGHSDNRTQCDQHSLSRNRKFVQHLYSSAAERNRPKMQLVRKIATLTVINIKIISRILPTSSEVPSSKAAKLVWKLTQDWENGLLNSYKYFEEKKIPNAEIILSFEKRCKPFKNHHDLFSKVILTLFCTIGVLKVLSTKTWLKSTKSFHIFLKSELSWTIRIVVCGSISDWIRA